MKLCCNRKQLEVAWKHSGRPRDDAYINRDQLWVCSGLPALDFGLAAPAQRWSKYASAAAMWIGLAVAAAQRQSKQALGKLSTGIRVVWAGEYRVSGTLIDGDVSPYLIYTDRSNAQKTHVLLL